MVGVLLLNTFSAIPSLSSVCGFKDGQEKTTFVDIEEALHDKQEECKNNLLLQDMLGACEEVVNLFQKRFLWSHDPHEKLTGILNSIHTLNLLNENADVEVAAVNRALQQVFNTLGPCAVLLGEGRVKAAYEYFENYPFEPSSLRRDAYIVAKERRGLFGKLVHIFHEYEMEKEFGKITKVMQAATSRQNLGFPEKGSDEFFGRVHWKTAKASADLEHFIRNPTIGFSHRVSLGAGFLHGLQALHEAGFVHGDVKPANALVYNKTKNQVKISDFGETRQLGSSDEAMPLGDPSFVPPEGRLSYKGEVYSAAISLIRIFEEEILEEGPILCLEEYECKTRSFSSQRLRGIEQFLTRSKNCPQNERRGIVALIKFFISALCRVIVARSQGDLEAAERETHKYIEALIERLKSKHPEISTDTFRELECSLKEMTRLDPEKRPTMREAVKKVDAVWRHAGPVASAGD